MKKKNIILLIIAIVLFILLGTTMAYFGWSSSLENKDQLVDVTVSGGTGSCDKLEDNEKLLYPTSTREKGRILKIKAKQQMAANATITWNLVVNSINESTLSTTGLKHKSFKYELVNDTTLVSYGTGSFENVTNGTTITLSTDKETLDYNKEYTFILYLWIDGTIGNNPLDMANQPYNFDLNCNITGASTKITPPVPSNMAQYIKYQYNNSTKTSVTNNNITYQYDTLHNLMKDVGGNIRYYGASNTEGTYAWQSTTTSILSQTYLERDFTSAEDCTSSVLGLCTANYANLGFDSAEDCKEGHSQILKNAIGYETIKEAQDNYCTNTIIYPLNNYIYFNCSDYANQSSSTCEVWRIIGVFDGKVKIMRNESIGSYSWDNKNTSTGAETEFGKNDWTTARLMKLLNPSDYYTVDTNDNGYGQSLYYNAQSGTCFSGQNNATTSCNFTSTGIKNDTTRNMIAEVTWNLGGWNLSSVYPNQIYTYERGTKVYTGRPTTWTGKIALAYPSDYGYAADLSLCTQTLNKYNNTTCTANNWMKSIMTSNYNWLLTPDSSYAYGAWYVYSSGNAGDGRIAYSACGAAPVLYLNSELAIESGDGSSSNPYKLSA